MSDAALRASLLPSLSMAGFTATDGNICPCMSLKPTSESMLRIRPDPQSLAAARRARTYIMLNRGLCFVRPLRSRGWTSSRPDWARTFSTMSPRGSELLRMAKRSSSSFVSVEPE